jgi:hypothetical protein
MTADEIACKLNEDVLSIRPRVTELKKLEIARETGEKRENERSGKRPAVGESIP